MRAEHFKRMKEQINKNYENLREGKEAYEAPQCEIIELDAEFNLLLTDSEQQNPGYGPSTDSYGW